MKKRIEHLSGNGTLTIDGSKSVRVKYEIATYRKYVETKGYGEPDYSPGTIELQGKVTLDPRDIPGPLLILGKESNILDVGNGRRIDVSAPVFVNKLSSFTFAASRDEMNFFDTPLYQEDD